MISLSTKLSKAKKKGRTSLKRIENSSSYTLKTCGPWKCKFKGGQQYMIHRGIYIIYSLGVGNMTMVCYPFVVQVKGIDFT